MSVYHLDRVRLKIAHKIANYLAKTKVAPHHVTLFRFILAAPLCAYFFSRGDYIDNIFGLTVYILLAILDWVDGYLAKITGQLSVFGKWLDETTDRVLVQVVLVSLFYPQIVAGDQAWLKLILVFYSSLFFMTAMISDFDWKFKVEFSQYPEIEKKVFEIAKNPGLVDRILLNFLYVQRNAVAQFIFTVSYLLLLGIITNQLLITFALITLIQIVRSVGFLFIMYRTMKKGDTNSALTKVLRGYLKDPFAKE